MSNLKDQLWVELKRDKKRATVLALLAVIALIVVGRLVLKRVSFASAKSPQSPPTAAAAATPEAARPSPGQETKHDDYLTRIDTTIKRDIFSPPEQFFPPMETPKTKVVETLNSRAAEKESIQKAAATMTVESTILSAIPKAIINGQLVQLGDTVNGFRIVEISSRTVTLEREGMTVQLEMKSEP
jgi:hypothetical protein